MFSKFLKGKSSNLEFLTRGTNKNFKCNQYWKVWQVVGLKYSIYYIFDIFTVLYLTSLNLRSFNGLNFWTIFRPICYSYQLLPTVLILLMHSSNIFENIWRSRPRSPQVLANTAHSRNLLQPPPLLVERAVIRMEAGEMF